jgi:hypothetical protein
MIFISSTVTDVGRLAMCATASATCIGSKVGSTTLRPSGCNAPKVCPAAIDVCAFPGKTTVASTSSDIFKVRTNVDLRHRDIVLSPLDGNGFS